MATGIFSPIDIFLKDTTDHPVPSQNVLQVSTLDANAAFYREVGLPQNLVFDGKELVLEAKFGYGYKLRALWETIHHHRYSEIGISDSEDFTPPLGRGEGPVIAIPTSVTHSTIDFGVLWGSAQVGVRLAGSGKVSLGYETANGANKSPTQTLSFTNATQRTVTADIPLTPLGRAESSYGFHLKNPRYDVDLSLLPTVRIDVHVGLSCVSRHFSTEWIDLEDLAVNLGDVTLPRHRGTRSSFNYAQGDKQLRRITNFDGAIKDGDDIGIQFVKTGKYLEVTTDNALLKALGSALNSRETFRVLDRGDDKLALHARVGQFVRGGIGNESAVGATSEVARGWETFRVVKLPGGKCALLSTAQNKYVTVRADGLVLANATSVGKNETFRLWPKQN